MAKQKETKNGADGQKKGAGRFKLPDFVQKRSFRYGSTATIFTAVFIVAVILVNVLVSALSARFPISFDMTATQKSSLSQKSIDFVKKIDQDVHIDILTNESTYANADNYNAALRIMQQYGQYNPKIKLDYVSINNNPTYAAQYSAKETLNEADIIVRSGSGENERYKHIASGDLIPSSTDSTTGNTTYNTNETEQQIDSALAYVTTKDLPTVLVTQGHNETDISGLTGLLQKNNYTVETKTLATDGLDQNATLLIVAAPTTDFTSDDIAKLDTFLQNGGKYGKNVMLIFDPQQSKLPNLESFAKKWGITVGQGVVYDTTNSYNQNPFNILEGDLNSDYTGSINSNLHAVVSVARPLTLDFQSQGGYTTASVMSSQSTSKLWDTPVVSNATAQSFQPSNNDKAGPFTVMALSTQSVSGVNAAPSKSNVLVLGSTNFIDSSLLSESSYSNSTIMLNTLSNVIGYKPGITVESKDLTATTLSVTGPQVTAIVVIFAILLPIGVLIAGIFVWLRRRNQ